MTALPCNASASSAGSAPLPWPPSRGITRRLRIEHQNGRVVLLLKGQSTGCQHPHPDQQQGLAGLPLVSEQLLDGWFGAAGLIDPAALLEAIKQGLAGGRQADAEAGHWQTGRGGGQSRCRGGWSQDCFSRPSGLSSSRADPPRLDSGFSNGSPAAVGTSGDAAFFWAGGFAAGVFARLVSMGANPSSAPSPATFCNQL